MFNKILVPLDGSALAERAIPHAEQVARLFGGKIVLLQVLDPSPYQDNPNAMEPLHWQIRKAEADMYLQGIADRIRTHLGGDDSERQGRVTYAIREGKTAENIVDFAQDEDVELLVVSTHGAGGLSRWNTSSVVLKVLDRIYLPALIVRAYVPPGPVGEAIHYRRILLPVDSSHRAECALSSGIALAQAENQELRAASTAEPMQPIPTTSNVGAGPEVAAPQAQAESGQAARGPETSKLVLATIVRPPELPIPAPYPAEIEAMVQQFMAFARKAVTNYLGEIQSRMPVESEVRLIEENSVSGALLQLSEQEDFDLVILCAHGQTGRINWPYGSVTRNYIDHGTRTVLVIQDIHRSQVRPTAAEVAAKKSGRR